MSEGRHGPWLQKLPLTLLLAPPPARAAMLPPASKRLRLDREPPTKAVLPVATQLARWWRDKQRDPETFMDPELAPLLPSSRSRFGGATDFSGGGGSDFAGGGGRDTNHRPPAPSDNPHTTLLRLGRTKAARQMLAGLAAQHSAQLAQGADANGAERQKQLHVALSACFLWLGDSGKAVQQLMQLRESFGRLSDHQSLLLHLAGCQHSNGARSTERLPTPFQLTAGGIWRRSTAYCHHITCRERISGSRRAEFEHAGRTCPPGICS